MKRWSRAFAALLLLTMGCPEPSETEDAGPAVERPGIEPDLLLEASAGALRVGASKRDISPQGFEVANPNYLGFRNPGNCDPIQKFRGAGHRHELSFSQIQIAQVLGGARTETETLDTVGHRHRVILEPQGDPVTHVQVTIEETHDHSHEFTLSREQMEAVDFSSAWSERGRLMRCGDLVDGYGKLPRSDCGHDGLCEGDPGWPGADEGEGDRRPDWFFDCGLDRICPDNVPEPEDLRNNGEDDDFDGVIDDGPYPGADEGEGNGSYDGLWQSGFGSNIPTLGLHDPIWARCMALERGDATVVVCSLDLVGFFFDDVERVRTRVAEAMGAAAPDYLLISATHVHEAPDALGQWGPIQNPNDILPRVSGVNPRFIERVKAQTALAVQEAMEALQPARLKVITTRTGMEGFLRDTRDPQVMDDTATLIQALATSDGSTIMTLYNWGNHPEILADVNNLVSSDFAHGLREHLEQGSQPANLPGLGGIAIYLQGTVGGLMTPLGLTIREDDGRVIKRRSHESAWVMGRRLAEIGLRALASDGVETLDETDLVVGTKRIHVPVFNTQFHVALQLGLFDRAVVDYDEQEFIEPGDELTPRNLPHTVTEVVWARLGPIGWLSVPGELFPENAVAGSLVAPFPYTPEGWDLIAPDNPNPPDVEAMNQDQILRTLIPGVRHSVLVGLGNDELGYLVPPYDWKLHPVTPYFDEAEGDHYEETNSTGPETLPLILDTLEGLGQWLLGK